MNGGPSQDPRVYGALLTGFTRVQRGGELTAGGVDVDERTGSKGRFTVGARDWSRPSRDPWSERRGRDSSFSSQDRFLSFRVYLFY